MVEKVGYISSAISKDSSGTIETTVRNEVSVALAPALAEMANLSKTVSALIGMESQNLPKHALVRIDVK